MAAISPMRTGGRIAVLPFENLSATRVPVKAIRQAQIQELQKKGVAIVDDHLMETVLARHRIRDTGGVDQETAQAFKSEAGADMILVTSLELYSSIVPPKFAMISRLVTSGDPPVILWMDSVALAGDDAPGILGLGLVEDPDRLVAIATARLADSLAGYLEGKNNEAAAGQQGRFKFAPKTVYRSPILAAEKEYTVVVAPFFNSSDRKYAGNIVALHFIRDLVGRETMHVIEPGLIRRELLNFRIIMADGLSLANADVVLANLRADLLLTGNVLEYRDYSGSHGEPRVEFSALAIDRESREVVWSSRSRNWGNEGVFLFDLGRVNTAGDIARRMTREVGRLMAEGSFDLGKMEESFVIDTP